MPSAATPGGSAPAGSGAEKTAGGDGGGTLETFCENVSASATGAHTPSVRQQHTFAKLSPILGPFHVHDVHVESARHEAWHAAQLAIFP
jgi:hypothetical protein